MEIIINIDEISCALVLWFIFTEQVPQTIGQGFVSEKLATVSSVLSTT